MMDVNESQIVEELKAIKEELRYIKEHMVDIDVILTPDEKEILKESIDEFKRGDTTKLEDLEREDE
ncbi:MAG: hypothetical protein JSW00_05290 [Thermoplasmata archaeon]|nr:MAG: hypothetical protein JSW00_05290 [Thermoplasmata archaeon]